MAYSLTGVGRMKILIALFSLSSMAFADAGMSVSYRSTPVLIQKNWLNDTKWPEEAAYYEGITTRRSLNMMTINIYLDDTVKAHDKKTTGGHYVERYYIMEFEEPSKSHPAGRMIEKEIDIGDATVDQINTKNALRDKDDRAPKVY